MSPQADRERPRWFALVLRVPREAADELGAELAALGRGVESKPVDSRFEEIRAFLRGGRGQADEMRRWAERRLDAMGVDLELCSFADEEVEDGRWVERYQEALRPFPIGKGFTVHPRGRIETDDGRKPLLLVPGRAFGTGEHATTQLCTEQLERRVRPGQAWLDVGCGSGILLLVARALGAGRLAGVEIDPEAVVVARGVLERNGAPQGCEVREGGLEDRPRGPWDGVICNISTTFARMHVEPLAKAPKPGGLLLVSGILRDDVTELSGAFAAAGMREIERVHRAPWSLLVVERTS